MGREFGSSVGRWFGRSVVREFREFGSFDGRSSSFGVSRGVFVTAGLSGMRGDVHAARMLKQTVVAALSSLVVSTQALAQEAPKPAPPPAPITASAGLKSLQTMVKGFIIRAAEAMPEEDYAFKPTPDVRSFGEIVAHVANTQ